MARLFQVNLPMGLSSVKLDSQGRATVQYVVKNVSARPLDGRALLISLPQVRPPKGPVEQGWVKIDGKADRHFDVNREESFTVRIAVPPKSLPGEYTFRLDAAWVDQIDQGDEGGAIRFAVTAPDPSRFPLWLIPVLLLVVVGLGIGGWLLLSGVTVPNLKGQTTSQAEATLKGAGLALDSNIQYLEDKPENSGLIVSSNPGAGQKADKEKAVQVTVGAQVVAVPLLIGQPFQAVQDILGEKGLSVGQSTTVENQNFAGGIVTSQNPAPQQSVKTGTPIDVQVTPLMAPVQGVIGLTLGSAILNLQRVGFKVTEFEGDTTKAVINQDPLPNVPKPVGSSVKLFFPASALCRPPICRFSGAIATQIVLDKAMATRKALAPAQPNQ